MSDQQKPTDMTAKETEFWMQAYIAFIPRFLESPALSRFTPADIADKAVVELRERLGTCQPQYETLPTLTPDIARTFGHTMNNDCPICKGMPREVSCG